VHGLCEEIAVLTIFRRLFTVEVGATALEYALIVSLVGLAALQVTYQMAGARVT
jgi:Flp pilus assembly pilin Flp